MFRKIDYIHDIAQYVGAVISRGVRISNSLFS